MIPKTKGRESFLGDPRDSGSPDLGCIDGQEFGTVARTMGGGIKIRHSYAFQTRYFAIPVFKPGPEGRFIKEYLLFFYHILFNGAIVPQTASGQPAPPGNGFPRTGRAAEKNDRLRAACHLQGGFFLDSNGHVSIVFVIKSKFLPPCMDPIRTKNTF